ncbi:cholinesterase 1-like [Lytechinus variegatus]|uniref:cholinesterase 1-like n=1 Tax=Lytechinus variegatus TaxID=7654 RepID=UPI001BB21108|nr:cholinesterase 1-like [Lytechinus variegatus]
MTSMSLLHLASFLVVASFLSLSLTVADIINDDQQPVVRTARATIRGKRFEVSSKLLPGFERTVDVYSRIPYADPPVGDLRYTRPVPRSIEGDFEATRDPIGCAQVLSPFFVIDIPFSEDCLYLDVTVPNPKPKNGAVMVWIHGGGYHVGAGRMSEKDTLFYAARADVILVTMNYRLGMLGFMTTGDDNMPANLGLLDQRQALIWIQENIAAFGGDPSRVTIFGESAGSGSVNLHLLSTMSAGLFSGAIMQSGALAMWTHHSDKQTTVDMTKAFAMELGCDVSSSVEIVTCLREKSVEDMQNVQSNVTMEIARYMASPVPDGEFLLKDPYLLAAEGSFNPANIMIGCLSEEGNIATMPAMFGQDGPGKAVVDEEAYRGYMTNVMQMADPITQDIAAVVFGSDKMFSTPAPDYVEVASGILGDSMFVCPTFTLAQQIAQAGRNVFTYFMTHEPSHSMWGKNMTGYGATHGEDLQYVFGIPFLYDVDEDKDYYMVGRLNEEEIGLSLQMIRYWSNFGKTGDPNLSSVESDVVPEADFPVWPKYTTTEAGYKEITASFENRYGNPNVKRCHFLESILPKLLGNAAEMERLKSLLEEQVSDDSNKSCDDPDSCP